MRKKPAQAQGGRMAMGGHCEVQNYRNSRSKAARSPSWSFGPDQLDHARLSWRIYQIVRPSGREPAIKYKIQTDGGLGASAGAEAGACLCGGSRKVAQWAAAAITSAFPRAWGAARERSVSTHAMQV
eukprot:6212812-Pleurochrysis_carterae.AAC.1